MKVLFIEDYDQFRYKAGIILSAFGHDVTVAEDTERATKCIMRAETPFEIVSHDLFNSNHAPFIDFLIQHPPLAVVMHTPEA